MVFMHKTALGLGIFDIASPPGLPCSVPALARSSNICIVESDVSVPLPPEPPLCPVRSPDRGGERIDVRGDTAISVPTIPTKELVV